MDKSLEKTRPVAFFRLVGGGDGRGGEGGVFVYSFSSFLPLESLGFHLIYLLSISWSFYLSFLVLSFLDGFIASFCIFLDGRR